MSGFTYAHPVWEKGKSTEMNYELSFRTVCKKEGKTKLRLATSGNYRVWVNGKFAAFGPARAARGFFKIDTLILDDWMTEEENVIVADVCGYGVNNFYVPDQPAFFAAELWKDEECIAGTGEKGTFACYNTGCRVQKSQRYTIQRTFTEVYRFSTELEKFYVDGKNDVQLENVRLCETEDMPGGKFEERDIRYPQYVSSLESKVLETGLVDFENGCDAPNYPSAYKDISEILKGFLPECLDEPLSNEIQQFGYSDRKKWDVPKTGQNEEDFGLLLKNGYAITELPMDLSGFINVKISCEEPCTVYVLFDEVLTEGDIDFLRMTACDCVKYYLDKGDYFLQSFEPYTMKYLKVIVKGEAVLHQTGVLQYKHENPSQKAKLPNDPELQKIYAAAVETYLANAADNYYDCPSRERGGWLCDSFFMARAEKVLTGDSVLEKAFLKNFIDAEEFPYLPKGMLPMCYPADFNNGSFIPQWAMWFVLELEEYYERSKDTEFINRAKERVYDLLAYFVPFENEYGLLENLEGWSFIEWSKANDWIEGVSFPTNMLYGRTLEAVGHLYEDAEAVEKGCKVKETVRQRSLKDLFFTDHELRTENGFYNPGDCSEVCQYYAFFTGTAEASRDTQLWMVLTEEFGPDREEKGGYEQVAPSAPFIGNYLRLECLYQEKLYEKVVENCRGYFLQMAEESGTLWEAYHHGNSRCHGFASHVVYWLAGIYGVEAV